MSSCRMRIRRILLAGMVLAGGASVSLAANDAPSSADRIEAVVNDIPITQQQVERLTMTDEDRLFDQYQTQPDVYRKKVTDLRQGGQELLIDREVILQEFKKNLKIPESILDEIVSDRIKEQFQGDNIKMTKELELRGISKEEFKRNIREQFIINAMRDKFVPEPIISPKKVEDYYTTHQNNFKMEDQIRFRMLILNKGKSDSPEQIEQTRKRAGEILLQLKNGASFTELARSYSEGSTARDGGDTGWEDVSAVNTVLIDPLNKLKPGENSDVIEDKNAFYLLHLEERHPAHVKPLNDVRAEIEKTLAAQETKRLADQWITRLRNKTFIIHY